MTSQWIHDLSCVGGGSLSIDSTSAFNHHRSIIPVRKLEDWAVGEETAAQANAVSHTWPLPF